MSDIVYDSDEYHDDNILDLHREGSLPDLVLSSSLGRDAEFLSSMDLTGSTPSHMFDIPTDIESEYFTTLDQVRIPVRELYENFKLLLGDNHLRC